jgi:hypothetical protein
MSLRWKKDGVATLLVAALAAVAWASYKGWDWPIVASARVVAVLAVVVGLAICMIGGDGSFEKKPEKVGVAKRLFLGHGAVAFFLMIAVLIWPRHTLLAILVGLVGLLWLITTLRHTFTKATVQAEPAKTTRPTKPRKPTNP